MTFCDSCGHRLKPTAKFCGSCGTQVTEEETTSQDTNSTYTDSQVSDSTPPPKQKRSMGKAKKFGIGLVVLIVVFVVFVPFYYPVPQLSEQEIKDSSIGWPGYNEVLRNNDAYVGKIIHFSGEAIYVDNNYIHVDEHPSDWDFKRIRVNYDHSATLVIKNDSVSVYGTVIGLDTYSSLSGKQTVPEVNALIINGVLQP